MKDILDIKSVHQCNCCLGSPTLHPLASIIRLNQNEVEQPHVKFGFYTALLIENEADECCCCCCGRKPYDYSNGTLVFLPPEHVFEMNKEQVLPPKGWLLAFHPDLLCDTTLQNSIKNYTFFHYHKEEALHLSLREKNKVITCLQEMEQELRHPIDRHSRTLLSHYIELLLGYCTRFYERQFITRENNNQVMLAQLDRLLDHYIHSGQLQTGTLPSSLYCAQHLNISACYFDDLLCFESGKTLKEYVQQKQFCAAKKLLLQAEHTSTTVAQWLGYPSVQQFSLLFKKITGIAPDKYKKMKGEA